jgi:hypothetical protein
VTDCSGYSEDGGPGLMEKGENHVKGLVYLPPTSKSLRTSRIATLLLLLSNLGLLSATARASG